MNTGEFKAEALNPAREQHSTQGGVLVTSYYRNQRSKSTGQQRGFLTHKQTLPWVGWGRGYTGAYNIPNACKTGLKSFKPKDVVDAVSNSFSSPEAAFLLVSTKNCNSWPGPTTFWF